MNNPMDHNTPQPADTTTPGFLPAMLGYLLQSTLSKLETVQYLVPSERAGCREIAVREALTEAFQAGRNFERQQGQGQGGVTRG